MMRSLIVPKVFSSTRIKRENAIRKQIRPMTVCAIEIIGGRAQREISDPALFIHRDFSPVVRSPNIFPGIFGPGVIAKLTRKRDRVKNPRHFSCDYVVGTQVARWRFIFFSRRGSHKNKIFENSSGRPGLDSKILFLWD